MNAVRPDLAPNGADHSIEATENVSMDNAARTREAILPVPRLALRPEEAAASIGLSRETFDRLVLRELRVVRVGRLKLIPVAELGRWLERNGAVVLERER